MSSFNRVLIQFTLYNSKTVSYILQRVSLLRIIKIPISTSHYLLDPRNLTMTCSVSIIVIFNKFRFRRETAIVELFTGRFVWCVVLTEVPSECSFAIKSFDQASTDTVFAMGVSKLVLNTDVINRMEFTKTLSRPFSSCIRIEFVFIIPSIIGLHTS